MNAPLTADACDEIGVIAFRLGVTLGHLRQDRSPELLQILQRLEQAELAARMNKEGWLAALEQIANVAARRA